MEILITGGNGFIGSHLAEVLIEEGFDVSLLDLLYNKNTASLDCKKVVGDVRDFSVVKELVREVDIVIHLAAVSRVEWGQRDPFKCLETNTLSSLFLLEALRNKPKGHLIYASSREVYGEPIYLPVTEAHPKNPLSVYGVTKLASENLMKTYHQIYDLSYTTVRLSNVYGSPRDLPERVIPKFARLALNDQPLPLYGGEQILDFTFIDDVTDGLAALVKGISERNQRIINNDFHFTTNMGTSILDLAELLIKIFQSNSEVHFVSKRRYDVSKFVGDWEKARCYIGYKPKHTIQQGLAIYKRRLEEEKFSS